MVAVASLSLSACGDSSHAGAAAVVGGTRITTVDLQGVVTRGLADPTAAQQLGAQPDDFQRQVLTRLIQGVLVDDLAKEMGVTVTQQQIDAQRTSYDTQAGGDAALVTQAAQNGVGSADLADYIRTIVVRNAIGAKLTASISVPDAQLKALYQQNIAMYDQVHVAHILVASESLANTIYKTLQKDPSQFAALAKKYSTDTSNKDNGGDLGFAGKGTYVAVFENAIFKGKVGTILAPVHSQFGWHVIHIIARKTTTFDEAKADLRNQALAQQQTDALTKALTAEAVKEKISVSPRYGKWDPTQSMVVASDNGLSSPGPSPSASPVATDDSGVNPIQPVTP